MKNLQNLESLEALLESNIKLGEIEGFNLYEIYKEAEPLLTLGQDVISLKKPELLVLLDKAMWAIRGFYERFDKLQIMEEQAKNCYQTLNIIHEKMAAYQKPLADKGNKFPSGRKKGSISDNTKHIRELVNLHPKMSVKRLMTLADKKIIGDMPFGTFKNKVTDAKIFFKN